MDSDTQVVCYGCIEDAYLKRLIKREGITKECSFCSRKRKTISIESLADKVEIVLSEYYRPGDEYPVWGDGDKPDYIERRGDPLDFHVGEILQCDNVNDVVEAICCELQSRQDRDDPSPLYDGETNIVPRNIRPIEAELGWFEFKESAMHGSRFFNGDAKAFLDWLFKGIEVFHGFDNNHTKVVRTLEPGQKLFRARLARTMKDAQNIIEDPASQLFAPPPEHAAAGRMNPTGVPCFYGAYDRETCIAELRPPVGGQVVSGEFELTRQLRILDFKQLESAYEGQALSIFQPDYQSKYGRRQFLKTLHHKISIPVLPNQEHEYLTTQVIAEYLGSQLSPPLDGVIFSSAQYEGGLNIALFPRCLKRDNSMQVIDSLAELDTAVQEPAIKFVPNSLVLHDIKSVLFNTSHRSVGNGHIELFIEDYEDEWDY